MPDTAMSDYLDHGPAPIRLDCGCVLHVDRSGRADLCPTHSTVRPAATEERLALAVELDELERPQLTRGLHPVAERYMDTLERIASDALGHCQRLERELDDLRRAHAEEPVTRMDAVELEVRRLRRDLTEVRRMAHGPVPADPSSDALQAAFRAQEQFRAGQDTTAEPNPDGSAPGWVKMDTL